VYNPIPASVRERSLACEESTRLSNNKEEVFRRILDTIPAMVWTALPDGDRDFVNQCCLDYTGLSMEESLGTSFPSVHPEDRPQFVEKWKAAVSDGSPMEAELRLRRRDGKYRWFLNRAIPMRDDSGRIVSWFGASTDVDDHRHAVDDLIHYERQLRQVIDVAPLHMFIWEADGSVSYGNRTSLEYFGPIPPKHPMEFLDLVTHPEDVERLKAGIQQAFSQGKLFEMETRMRRHDGQYHWFLYRLCPLPNESGRASRWCGIRIDIEEHKRVEQDLLQRERELQQLIEFVPQHMVLLGPDFRTSYGNQSAREYFGRLDRQSPEDFARKTTHPDDLDRLLACVRSSVSSGEPGETEVRIRNRDGQYRWFLHQIRPLRDDRGVVTRWCVTRVDIDDSKRANERAERENLALRDEIDKVSMFEEIVGTSLALQTVLARVAKVAPTDSTVLITGETGTGKELIARAIHKRSQRSAQAFVSVNCAAIPKDLIASELFGHEKGAFTGALQRRLGRFELAEGGSIFLDEIGELPAETQVALLRVLQEREFDRVGGSRPIRADVRVIAATHRDLPALIATGTFRSDLFYRVNVFPIEVPPLRERREDIRLLVEYFIDRFSTNMGKKIRRIDKKSMDSLRSYPWPGNIRELQNVIERSVIVCDTEDFSIDESWLTHASPASKPLAEELGHQEKELIEAALAKTKGRISGQSGAAAILGMPPSTLDSKIKSLKIDKRRFNAPGS
jgi:PAS domain S-box-containing protein